MKRKFSWKNFFKFVGVSLAIIFSLWLLWGIIDINIHNEKKFESPSNLNPFVIFVDLLESEVN